MDVDVEIDIGIGIAVGVLVDLKARASRRQNRMVPNFPLWGPLGCKWNPQKGDVANENNASVSWYFGLKMVHFCLITYNK
jgi:hypothetical protein